METPVSYQITETTFSDPYKEVIIVSGFIELNASFCFDTEEGKLLIPFVKAIVKPRGGRGCETTN